MTDMPSIDEKVAALIEQLPAEYRSEMNAVFTRLIESGAAGLGPRLGDAAPDFALPTADGRRVQLSDLWAQGPVVLSFYRGEWCPICCFEMTALLHALPEMRRCGASLVALGPEPLKPSAAPEPEGFYRLHDAQNGVGLQYGLVWRLPERFQALHRDLGVDLARIQGDDSWFLPIPATFVIDGKGRIALAFVDADYTHRLEPAAILDRLAVLSGEAGPA